MPTDIFGWCGRILKVDLSEQEVSVLDTLSYADRFLGGRGIASKIYWENVGPGVSAFDPENHLILMSGPLGATGAQGASRFEVVGKSPMLMPEGFCYGNLGGFFGPYLKRAGYDGIVITGRSEKPVYIYISEQKTAILDASPLWGKGVYAVKDILNSIHGKSVRFVTTGVAGENMCRSANLMTDNEGSATGGFGAVMGAKKLKAVAVTGTGHPRVARPDALQKLNRQVIHLSKSEPMTLPFSENEVRRTGKASCYQCGLDCNYRSSLRTASGKNMVRKCQSMFVYLPWVMARPEESAETALEATGICNDLSICTMEMFNIVQWLDACQKGGYFKSEDIGIDVSQLGTLEFFQRLAHMIAYRKGFGDVLAEGLLRAGETLGEGAKAYFSNEVSGVGDGATYSAREYLMNGLLYALEPRQPIAMLHEISRMAGLWAMHQSDPQASPVSSAVFRAVAEKFWGHEQAWNLATVEGKAMAATKIIDRTYVKDSLLLCDSNWPLMVSRHTPDRVGDPALESRIYTAVTGIETDEAGLNRYGERIFNLQRGILLREGWRPKLDDVPAAFNFTDPVETVFMNPDVIVPGPGDEIVSRKGQILDRKDFDRMQKEFYELRGWNTVSGLQQAATLERLGLDDVMDDLKKMNLVDA
jgi:aldehyde:ferredoxin oxidoreductase